MVLTSNLGYSWAKGDMAKAFRSHASNGSYRPYIKESVTARWPKLGPLARKCKGAFNVVFIVVVDYSWIKACGGDREISNSINNSVSLHAR